MKNIELKTLVKDKRDGEYAYILRKINNNDYQVLFLGNNLHSLKPRIKSSLCTDEIKIIKIQPKLELSWITVCDDKDIFISKKFIHLEGFTLDIFEYNYILKKIYIHYQYFLQHSQSEIEKIYNPFNFLSVHAYRNVNVIKIGCTFVSIKQYNEIIHKIKNEYLKLIK